MVITREVPRTSWRRVLDDLSRAHAGASVTLTVLDDEHGLQSHGDTFRLVGLTADGETGSESIAAILALARGAHVTHIIADPRCLHLELLWESRTANLQIADANGRRTLICVGPPVLGAVASAGPDQTAARLRTFPPERALVRTAGCDPPS